MEFTNLLVSWYRKNKRDLPWRNTKDPYRIWLSEIILQQTRVAQGYSYYIKFIEAFPDVKSLAIAQEKQVLKLWQGLGYYSRARNLHFTAQQIVKKHGGVFPERYEEILQLKGIGVYTAAAIASFAYNQAYPVIDGNVYRVLSRIFGITTPIDSTSGRKEFAELAEELMPKNNPAEYNQAIMEFGALQCTPHSPDCFNCPFYTNCEARKMSTIKILPVKEKKVKKRIRYFNYLIIHHQDSLFINQRGSGDIWQGLYEFPNFESSNELTDKDLIKTSVWKSFFKKNPNVLLTNKKSEKHILTHQTLKITYWEIRANCEKLNATEKHYLKIPYVSLASYPLPRPIATYIDNLNL